MKRKLLKNKFYQRKLKRKRKVKRIYYLVKLRNRLKLIRLKERSTVGTGSGKATSMKKTNKFGLIPSKCLSISMTMFFKILKMQYYWKASKDYNLNSLRKRLAMS